MDSNTLKLNKKIARARTVSHNGVRKLEFGDINRLVDGRSHLGKSFLTYIDVEGNRREFSYKKFVKLVELTVAFLSVKGLKSGDRIATIAHNHWYTAVQYFAAWKMGLVVVPVNLGEDDERIAYILEAGEIKLVFAMEEYIARISGILDNSETIDNVLLFVSERIFEEMAISTENSDPEFDQHNVSADDEALIVFTSGTTGPPKAVVLTQQNLLEDARAIAEWHQIDHNSCMMCVLPIHHVNGTIVTLLTPFWAGARTVLNQKFQVRSFFQIIQQEQVHIVSVVPTLLQYLNNYYKGKTVDVPSQFHHIICGAGPLTIKIAKTFEERFEIPVIHGYGLSETTCYSCFLPIDLNQSTHNKWMRDFGYPSIGVPIPPNEMDIQTPEGESLPEGERGEIVIRGVNVMKGYHNNRLANEEAFKNGWFRSGDEGFYREDDDGTPYFFITGRLKELIIRGGVNLAPLEIDEVINKAPGVKAGIAVGFKNDWYGEEVGAYVQKQEGAEVKAGDIIKFCRKHLPFSKTPKVVIFGEHIPVTSTGKYQRRKVAHLFDEWKTKQFKPT